MGRQLSHCRNVGWQGSRIAVFLLSAQSRTRFILSSAADTCLFPQALRNSQFLITPGLFRGQASCLARHSRWYFSFVFELLIDSSHTQNTNFTHSHVIGAVFGFKLHN